MAQKLKPNEGLIPIEDVAAAWGVDPRTIKNWCEFVYQSFEIMLPSGGPFPEWGVQLLNLTAKHVSEKASLYFSETGERRRLKGSEFVKKIRSLRAEGHFQEFQKFQKFQNFRPEGNAEDLEDETLAELAELTRQEDETVHRIKETIERREDEQIEELADFIEDGDRRKMSKLVRRLRTGKASTASIANAIDVAYSRLPEDPAAVSTLPAGQ